MKKLFALLVVMGRAKSRQEVLEVGLQPVAGVFAFLQLFFLILAQSSKAYSVLPNSQYCQILKDLCMTKGHSWDGNRISGLVWCTHMGH